MIRKRTILAEEGNKNKYLTFVSLQDGTIVSFSNYTENPLYYSLDEGTNWTLYDESGPMGNIVLSEGETVMWKGELCDSGSQQIGNFYSSDGAFDVEGNIMSLLYGDNYKMQKSLADKDGVFASLFSYCNVVNAENLLLPATTLAEMCYQYMFRGCESLTTAPELPATTLAQECYSNMFEGCTSLTTVPSTLPATTLITYCYDHMFDGCTGLTTIPSTLLPATTLADYCYYNMFSSCSFLTTTPELPATNLASYCYSNMFKNCISLTIAPALPATTLTDHCYDCMF